MLDRFSKIFCIMVAVALSVVALAACSQTSAGAAPSSSVKPPPANSPAPTTTRAPSLLSPTPAAPPNSPPISSTTPGPSVTTSGAVSIPAGKPAGPFKSTLIDAQVSGDVVTVPLAPVASSMNARFKLTVPEGQEMFMVYVWDGKVQVRASICPPCRGQSFTLSKGILVCDTCGTVFDAATGKGISGACIAYTKQSASHKIDGNNLIISKTDLITAYKNTLSAGR